MPIYRAFAQDLKDPRARQLGFYQYNFDQKHLLFLAAVRDLSLNEKSKIKSYVLDSFDPDFAEDEFGILVKIERSSTTLFSEDLVFNEELQIGFYKIERWLVSEHQYSPLDLLTSANTHKRTLAHQILQDPTLLR